MNAVAPGAGPSLGLSIRTLVLAMALAATGPARPAAAQPLPMTQLAVPAALDSGPLDNPEQVEKVVFSQVVAIPGAPWLRLVFDHVKLAETSTLRITSFEDGEEQTLDNERLAQWQGTTAYFNGHSVLVELIAGPGTTGNRAAMTRLVAGSGDGGIAQRRVCDTFDNRVPSANPRVARLLPILLPLPACAGGVPCDLSAGGCSGFIINTPLDDDADDRLMLTAGHCLEASGLNNAGGTLCSVAQFETIAETNPLTCALRHPPVAKQFPINAGRFRNSTPGGCSGNDWGVFTCFKNSLNKTVFQEQAAAFSLAPAAPANGSVITKTGYGADGPLSQRHCGCVPGDPASARNATQQTAVGAVQSPVGVDHLVKHNAHTCGGDSGCALTDNMARVVAVHTGGGCNPQPSTPLNCGSAITNPNLVAAMAQVAASAAPRNDACAGALQVLAGTTPFSTVAAATDGPREALVNNAGSDRIDNDIWFRYTSIFTGPTLFSVCDSSYDTRLAIYTDACPIAPNTALAANDDNPTCSAASPTRSALRLATTAGTTYLVRVGGFGNQTGRGTLTIAANDDCDVFGILLAGGPIPPGLIIGDGPNLVSTAGYTTTTTGAAPDPFADGGCFIGRSQRRDAWFLYPSAGGPTRFQTCGVTGFDTCLAVYRYDNTSGGPAGPPNCAALGARQGSDDDGCGGADLGSRLDLNLAAGIYIVRLGSSLDHSGSTVITISPGIPANDLCANAAAIVANTPTPFNNHTAGTDGPATNACGTFHYDVWFRFTAGVNGTATADLCAPATPAGWDTNLSIHADNCANLNANEIACRNDFCGVQSRVSWPVTAGTNYLVRAGSWRGTEVGAGSLLVTESAAGPTNNDCAQALPVGEGSQPFNTAGATGVGPDPVACLTAGANADLARDIWFTHTTPRTGNFIVSTCDATFDDRIAAYAGGCGGLGAAVACGDDDCGPAPARHSRLNLPVTGTPAAPVTHLLRLGSYYNPGPPLPPPPADIGAPTGTGTLTLRFLPNDTLAALVANLAQAGNGPNLFDSTGADSDATAFGPVAPCAGADTISHDLFWLYRATDTGTTAFSVCAGFSNTIAVYSTALATLACDKANAACPGGRTQSSVNVPTVAGTSYIVRVGGTAAGRMGEGTLTITRPNSQPDNNDCNNSSLAYLGDTPFTTANASTDGPNPVACLTDGLNMNCGRDVWFIHTATGTGTLTVDTCDATFDNRVVVYPSGACPPPAAGQLCGDDNCGTDSTRARLSVPVTAGTAYTIRIGGYHSAVAPIEANYQTGTGTLKLRMLANDTCASAAPVIEGATSFNTTDANTDGNAHANCAFFGNDQITSDLWYLYTAPATGRLVADTLGSTFDTKLAVYAFPPGAACPPAAATLPEDCNDDAPGAGTRSRVGANATIGFRYLIRVGGFNGAAGAGVLNVKLIRNDACARATVITPGTHPFDTLGATQDGAATCGNSNTTPDVWFSHTATCTGDLVANACTATYDTVLTVYTGPCATRVEAACNDDSTFIAESPCAGTNRSFIRTPVTAGTVYLIRVSGFNGAVGDGWLTLGCEPAGACCVGAICRVRAPSECAAAGSAFIGPGAACNVAGNHTAPCCKADFNHSGAVTVQDIFDFLAAYFAGLPSADFDADGNILIQDLFDYLGGYFAGCP